MLSRFILLLFALAPVLLACSVPLKTEDDLQSQPVRTVEELLTAGHYRRALAQLNADEQSTDAPAKMARQQLLLSRTELGLGHFEAALELAEKANTVAPNDSAAHVEIAAAAGRLAEHAALFKQLGWAKRAKKELDEAVALDPRNADALYGLMLFADVAPSFLGGDKTKAQKLAEQLTELDPSRGYLAQATLAHHRKDAATEEALLKKAVGAGPKFYEAHIAYAAFLRQLESPRVDEADEQVCIALSIDPTRADAWKILAELAATAECWKEVDGLVSTAAKWNPDDRSPAYAAAAVMITAGKNFDMAQTLLASYLEQPQEGDTPSAGRARYQLAVVREKQGRNEEAVDLLRLALNEDPTLDDAKKDLKRLQRAERVE